MSLSFERHGGFGRCCLLDVFFGFPGVPVGFGWGFQVTCEIGDWWRVDII